MRDHLANERTLLAWVRTSLALVAGGIAIAKLATFLHLAALDHPDLAGTLPAPMWSKVLGLTLVLSGAFSMLLGAWRTHAWSREVAGEPPPMLALWAVAMLNLVIASACAAYIALG
jgi:putative membrane protein